MSCPACEPAPGHCIPVDRSGAALVCSQCKAIVAPAPEAPDSLAAIERAYETACVAYCDSWPKETWASVGFAPMVQAVVEAKAALDAARDRLRADQQDEEDMAIRHAIRRATHEATIGDITHINAHLILDHLRAAGFQVTRMQQP